MSNYLSQPTTYSQPSTDANFDLLSKVALMQQQKYDVNHQQIQQTIDAFGAMRTLRPQDDAYIAAKLNDITTKINSTGGNLASQTLTDSLMSSIKTAAQDPFILNALEQTQIMSSYQKNLATIKEKKPELYNDVNNAYALEQAGYEDYVAGKTDKMGTLSYTNYTDYKKEFKDFSENLDKYANVVKTTVPGGDGYMYTQDGKFLTKEQIAAKVGSLLSDGARKQMQIDGWAAYDKGDTEEAKLNNVKTKFADFKNRALSDLDESIAIARGEANSKPSDISIQQNLANLEKYRKRMEKDYNTLETSNNKAAMYTEMYAKESINNFASAFSFNNVSQTISEDAAYSHAVDLQYKMAKDAAASSKAAKDSAAAVQTKADEDYVTPEGKESLYDDQITRVDALTTEVENETNRVYNTLSEDNKKAIDVLVKSSKGKLTRTDVLLDKGLESSNFISAADSKKIAMLKQESLIEKEKLNKYTKQANEEAAETLDSDNGALARRLYANPNIKIMWRGTDGKERLYSAKQVLVNNHIIDNNGKVLGKIVNNKALSDALQKSMLADKYISTPEGRAFNADKLATLLGESPKDIYKTELVRNPSQVSPTTGVVTGGYTEQRVLNPNSKTAKFIENHRRLGGYNQAGIFSKDDSFDDIPEVDTFLKKSSGEEIKRRIGDLLYNDPDNTPGIGRVTTITPGTAEYTALAAVSEEFSKGAGYSLGIRLIPNQPNMVNITQKSTDKKDPSPKSVKMRIQDLPASILKQIDLQNKKSLFTPENLPTTPTHVSYVENDDIRIHDIANTHLEGNQALAETMTKAGALSSLFSGFPQKLGTQESPTELGTLVQKMINDKNIYVELNKTKLSSETIVVPQIVRKVGGVKTVIFTAPPATGKITNASAESAFNYLKFIPQLYVNASLSTALSKPDSTSTIETLKRIYGE